MNDTITTGTVVKFRFDWTTPGESGQLYRVTEWNGDRGYITPVETDMAIPGQELVREYMIELA